MKSHDISELKEYLDNKGYNVEFASEDEILNMYKVDRALYLEAKQKRNKNDTRN